MLDKASGSSNGSFLSHGPPLLLSLLTSISPVLPHSENYIFTERQIRKDSKMRKDNNENFYLQIFIENCSICSSIIALGVFPHMSYSISAFYYFVVTFVHYLPSHNRYCRQSESQFANSVVRLSTFNF